MDEPMTAQEIARRWDRDGYLVVRDAIPSAVLEPVRAFIRGCRPGCGAVPSTCTS